MLLPLLLTLQGAWVFPGLYTQSVRLGYELLPLRGVCELILK